MIKKRIVKEMESQSDSEQEIQEIIDLEIAEFRDVNGGLS